MKAISIAAALAIIGILGTAGMTTGLGDHTQRTAGGGGWFLYPDSMHEGPEYDGTLSKITFGIYLNANKDYWSESEMAFQARDWDIKVIADAFEWVKVNYSREGFPMAHAKGWALVSGSMSGHYWFHVQIWDRDAAVDEHDSLRETGVGGKQDQIHLRIFDEPPGHGEEEPTEDHVLDIDHGPLNWNAKLDGGNIWIVPPGQDR